MITIKTKYMDNVIIHMIWEEDACSRGFHPRGFHPRGIDPRGIDPRGMIPWVIDP